MPGNACGRLLKCQESLSCNNGPHPCCVQRRSPLFCTRASRHPEILTSPGTITVQPRYNVETDCRYRRTDTSTLLAYTARWRFCHNIAKGEPGMDLAEVALLTAAEDDAIASHSTVPFPVESYLSRIQKLAEEFESQRLTPLLLQLCRTSLDQSPNNWASDCISIQQHQTQGIRCMISPDTLLSELSNFLYRANNFRIPEFGRSNLPLSSMLDHPGVWEDARWVYMNELLIRHNVILRS
ncbi:hypothetical protein CEUSTIGMA_g3279.t1 [Chlamydomonas eustigma]|uniref:Uncharacterized protein n=1 Tax=Chlamydomonas eustigma TaxID=1157962 RepID=A0A250WYH8_9CHLO|nr:hypothetical protein CEUSTIGMA_g3279.t1 [Chlamydomonas eustigma]|eukprot:GAX75836.1 hypothetical protein CEUSTIGMA_g3279.t1 [Chlamydomonas eustigma]